ncbi:MAG: CHAD domain-containing protein [Ktedonobacterales bacterium]
MEIEAKYAILGPLNPTALSSLDAGPYHLYFEGESHHQDTLLDTPSRAITSGGQTLRLRRGGDHAVLTYKGPNRGSNGIHEREEVEVQLAETAESDYHQWPNEIMERVSALIGDDPLVPLVKLYIHRHRWKIERDDQIVGEMVLDQGIISAGGRTARVHELEVELKGEGERDDLREIGDVLLAKLPLQPQPRGKLQRGLALLSKDRTLDGHTFLHAVGLHMVRKHLRKLQSRIPVVLAGWDTAGIHDARVAVRRLRTTLRVLEASPVLPRKTVHSLRRRLRGVARGLGAVRDADVLLARVERDIGAHPELEADLTLLYERVHDQQQRAYTRLVKHLKSRKVATLLDELAAFVESKPPATSERRHLIAVRHFAGSAIWRRYETVLSYETVLPGAEPHVLHELRIACKRLRYTLEIFETELGKVTRPLLKLLANVQEHLGELQDTVVALNEVDTLLRKHPTNTGLGAYAALLAQERNRLQGEFMPLWNDVSDAGVSQELAELIAGL